MSAQHDNLDAALILAEKSAPRYTSYPTAPHFSPAVGAETATKWLAALPPASALSLYLHVPYCSAICNYCGCHTKAVQRAEPLDAYEDYLAREIDLVARLTPAKRVTDAHWGGGTPSLLGPNRLLRLSRALKDRFEFAPNVEYAIELDPRTVDPALVEALAACGFTRVSLGVQDLNHHVQEAIGRIQPFEVVETAVNLLRGAGIAAINLDLMYGLPEQTLEDVRHSMRLAAELNPSRLAIFGYAHVPWFKVHQRLIDASALPGAAERLQQAAAARRTLAEYGYEAIGLDHFAKPDDPLAVAARSKTMRRNFQGYTTDAADALLPFGVSSIGRLPQGYVQNAPDLGTWRRAIDDGRLPVVKGVAFSVEDLARGAVIEKLMCDFSVDYGAIGAAFLGDERAFDDALPELLQFERDGVITLAGRVVTLTEAGKPFLRLPASAFDAYLKTRAARHSVAV